MADSSVADVDAQALLDEANSTSADSTEPKFSLELNQDQKDIREWVHGFAANVVRPAAEEWDEREEFPWPVVQEAAKVGLYGLDFMANAMLGDPTGLTMPIAIEEVLAPPHE